MDDELVLLASYFNLANGGRQDFADTFRVDPSLPSSTSPDGKAALYIVTEASSTGPMGPRARRLAADTIAWEYSTHGEDAPIARLKAALTAAHEQILREFDGHVSVGASIIAVEGRDVYLAQVAPAQVYVRHDGGLNSIPAAVGGSSPFANALGSTEAPNIALFRDEVAIGDVLALGSSWFHRTVDADEIRASFDSESAEDIASALFEISQEHEVRDVSAVVIEAVLASELDSRGGGEAHSMSEQVEVAVQALTKVGRMLWSELWVRDSTTARNGNVAVAAKPDEAAPDFASPTVPLVSEHDEQSTTEIPVQRAGHRSAEPALGPQPTVDEPATWNPDDTATWDLAALEERESTSAVSEYGESDAPITTSYADGSVLSTRGVETQSEHRSHPDYSAPIDTEAEPFRDEGIPSEAEDDSDSPWSSEYEERTSAPTRTSGTRETPSSGHISDRSGSHTLSELDEVNSRIQNDPDLGDVIPPVQAFPDTNTTEPSRIYATSRDIDAANKRPRRFGGISRPARDASGAIPVIRPSVGDLDLRQPVARPAPGPAIWLSAVAILVLIAIALVLYVHRGGHTVAADPYPGLVAQDLRLAGSAKTAALQNVYLHKAHHNIALARASGDTAANLQKLRARVVSVENTIFHITPETSPVLLASFKRPTEMAVGPNVIYVLDAGANGVFSVTPTTNSSPTRIVQGGEPDSGITFGTPSHIATSQSTALVLDQSNTLLRYSAGTKTATSLGAPPSGKPATQMVNYGPDVYLLDSAGNQIWRYADAVQGYNSVPTQFFSPNIPGAGQAVALTVDDKYVYLLKNNGQIQKFDIQAAGAQPFSNKLRTPFIHANAIFTDVGLPYVWVADPANGRIVQLDKSGNYVRSYVAGTGTHMDFSQIRSIAVPPSGKTLYVVAGTKLFDFPVTP